MSEQLQLRRGTAAQLASFTGAQGEAVVDTTNNRIVVNDGSTAGGWPAAKLAEAARAIGQSHIPFVLPGSGSMGNNGALTGMPTLPTTYASFYVYPAAGVIAAGSAAGWYYAVGSSATAATVYNNVDSGGTPAIPASPTAFSTTGPGAFNNTTGAYVAAYSLTVAGNLIGANGALRVSGACSYDNNSDVKSLELTYGGSAVGIAAPTTDVVSGFIGGFSNRGAPNSQVSLLTLGMATGVGASALDYTAVDSTQSQTLAFNLKIGSGDTSDFIVLENIVVELIPGVP